MKRLSQVTQLIMRIALFTLSQVVVRCVTRATTAEKVESGETLNTTIYLRRSTNMEELIKQCLRVLIKGTRKRRAEKVIKDMSADRTYREYVMMRLTEAQIVESVPIEPEVREKEHDC